MREMDEVNISERQTDLGGWGPNKSERHSRTLVHSLTHSFGLVGQWQKRETMIRLLNKSYR